MPRPSRLARTRELASVESTTPTISGEDYDWTTSPIGVSVPSPKDQWKQPVRVATTASVTISTALNSGDTLDGITLAAGDRVLVKDQATASQNGIYVVAATPARAADFDEADEVMGALVAVIAGTTNAGTVWRCTNTTAPTIDTTSLTFSQFSSGSATFADLGWFNVEDYGAVHNGSTDDTASIQAAINACATAGGGTVFFPAGIYQIAGALQDTGTYNSQLEIPDNAPGQWMAIRLLGADVPGPNRTERCSVLRSTWSGTISGTPAIISAGTHDSTSANYVVVTFENIVVEAPENPKLTAIDMTNALAVRWDELAINVTRAVAFTFPVPWTVPTNANAIGMDMPFGLNSQPMDGGGALYVEGFYTGLRPSEQCAASLVKVAFCARGIEFRGNVGTPAFRRHLSSIEHVASYWNPRSIVFSGDETWVHIGSLDIEHDSAPFTAVYDIDDASNYGRGFVGWHTTDFTTGPEDNLLVNGGTGLSLHGGYAKRWRLASAVDVPTGTDPSTNPSTGFRLYAASATGKPTTRSTAGTVTTIMREGDTAGGDLSGTYPNPTVTDDSHSHTAATLPATTSGGVGDHEHMVDVFAGDGGTTAFELSDEPLDPEAVVAYVAGSETAVAMSGTMNTTATFGAAPSAAARVVIQYPAVSA